MSIPTPHISAAKEDFADTVLMPGDPKRSKFIADNFLKDAKLINDIRGISGYTGTYNGKKVSVMASGMGMPSMGIYSYELFNFYDVKNIIRVGTAGAISDELNLFDIVIGMGACTNSNYSAQFGLPGTVAAICSYELLEKAVSSAKEMNLPFKAGNLFSADTFYDDVNTLDVWNKMGVLAVEMEANALYLNALRAGKNALAICTISDIPAKGKFTTAEQRQNSFTQMMELALSIA